VPSEKVAESVRKDAVEDLRAQLVRLKNKGCNITSVIDDDPAFLGAICR
jgi:hypothetical protein